MKIAGMSLMLILLLVYVTHAETTGTINIGQPQSPVVADSTTPNMTNQSGIAAKTSGSDDLLLLIFVIVVLLILSAIYLIRRYK